MVGRHGAMGRSWALQLAPLLAALQVGKGLAPAHAPVHQPSAPLHALPFPAHAPHLERHDLCVRDPPKIAAGRKHHALRPLNVNLRTGDAGGQSEDVRTGSRVGDREPGEGGTHTQAGACRALRTYTPHSAPRTLTKSNAGMLSWAATSCTLKAGMPCSPGLASRNTRPQLPWSPTTVMLAERPHRPALMACMPSKLRARKGEAPGAGS